MTNPVLHPFDGSPSHQQILEHFALNDLLHRLKTYSSEAGISLETQELESLAALLIQALAANLDDDLVASYLEAIRHHKFEVLGHPSSLKLPAPCPSLPSHFPNVETPQFLYGDRLRWISDGQTTDWGIVIGRFYSFAPHRCQWAWSYLILLDPNSPSSGWVTADLAWEENLEPLEAEELRCSHAC